MFGERLKLARKKAGFSLRKLSEALSGNVSAQSIGKYERGEMMPSSGILMQLTDVLDISLEYLMSEQVAELKEIEFRKLSGITASKRAQVEAIVIEKLERYLAIEEILNIDSFRWDQQKFDKKFVGEKNEGEEIAEDLRVKWELGIDPIPNMTALLENHGIKVVFTSLPKNVSGLTCLARKPDQKLTLPVIVINEDMTLERGRFTLAHELGHRLIDAESPVDHEKAANVFASAFLVPKNHLISEIGRRRNALAFKEFVHLKRRYRVSAATLLLRLKEVDIINQSTLSYAFQTYAKGWRSLEPYPLESDRDKYELPRRFELLCYRALAEKLISPSKACELLQRPLDEIAQAIKGPSSDFLTSSN